MKIQFDLMTLKQKTPICFFVIFFVVGLLVFKDYGLGWDDEYSRVGTGYPNCLYIAYHDKAALLNCTEKYHGPFFEIVLVVLEKAFGLKDTAAIYKMRHLVLFLTFFLAVLAFYFVTRKLTDKKYSLLACLFIILSPRIFAESFYNSKDIVFLSFFIFSLFSYFLFLEKRTILWAIIHGISTALLIDIRITGIIVPVLTIIYFIVLNLNEHKDKKFLQVLFFYLLSTILFTILCWPILWEGPLYHFGRAFVEMRKYHWIGTVLYNGQHLTGYQIPWHYLPVWILMTTPFLFILLFANGIISYVKKSCSCSIKEFISAYYLNSIIILFFVPLLAIIFFKSVVYDGWRHVYFIYPMLILIAVYGLESLFEHLKKFQFASRSLLIVVVLNLFMLMYWMAKNHPHQNVYFNTLSRKIIKDIPSKFELDYWGLSYKQGLEYILNKEQHQAIKISVSNLPGRLNHLILSKKDRERIIFCNANDSTFSYYLTNYRGEKTLSGLQLLKQIQVDDMAILGIYIPLSKQNSNR